MGNFCSGSNKEQDEYLSINQMARNSTSNSDGKKYGHTYATPTRHGVRYSVPDKYGIRNETNYTHEDYVDNNRPLRMPISAVDNDIEHN